MVDIDVENLENQLSLKPQGQSVEATYIFLS
jgi:hypothetical protein